MSLQVALHKADVDSGRYAIHYDTQNHTFIKVAKILQKLGVENNKFHLTIIQPELMKYDPHNLTDDSVELKQRIAWECYHNPWYYFREMIRMPIVGTDLTRYRLDRASIANIWLFYNGIDLFCTLPRQHGKTMFALAIQSHLQFISSYRSQSLFLAKDSGLSQDHIKHLKDIKDELPDWLVDKEACDNNKEGLIYKSLKNECRTYIAAMDKKRAAAMGRGCTAPYIVFDEAAYFVNIALSYPAVKMALSEAKRQARLVGRPYGTVVITTAGKLDEPAGYYCYNSLVSKALGYYDKLLDVGSTEQLKELVKKNSLNDMVYVTFSYLQLGKTKEWFEEQVRSTTSDDPTFIDRDLLNIWSVGSSSNPLPQELLNRIRDKEMEPLYIGNENEFVIRWFIPEITVKDPEFQQKPIILSMDSSEAIGQDFTALTFTDPSDLSVLATCRCNESNIVIIGKLIASFLIQFPNMVWIFERKSTGIAILDTVLLILEAEGIDPYSRIFNTWYQNNDLGTIRSRKPGISGKDRTHFGFVTTGNSRKVLYKSVLQTALAMNSDKIYDSVILEEIRTLTVKNGRIDHLSGCHDDQLISYLLGCYLLYYGKNLSLYGLDSNYVLSNVSKDQNGYDKREADRQKEYRSKLKEYTEKFNKSGPGMLKESYRRQIAYLNSVIDPEFNDTNDITLDKMAANQRDRKYSSGTDLLKLSNFYSSFNSTFK
jgi:hypothetical protein